MSKNIVIAILAILCVGLFFYGLIQKIEAEKQAKLASVQSKIAIQWSQQVQQKDNELANRNEQLQIALNEAREARERDQKNFDKAQQLYEMTKKQVDQANKAQEKRK